jgi:hypothetical protein
MVGPDSLTLLLTLSTWIRRTGLGVGDARDGLLGLRLHLLEVSGTDRTTEPVPLVVHDDRRAVVNLAVYMVGLIRRAAAAVGVDPSQIVEIALDGDRTDASAHFAL